MPEENKPAEEQGSVTKAEQSSGFTPPATQDELNKIIEDRLKRERAKYADYDDLKSKAAQYDRAEEANKTEVQKAADRAVAAEKERDTARIEALRFKVAAETGIQENVDLILTAPDEETMRKQATLWAERAPSTNQPKPDLSQGPKGDQPKGTTAEQFAAALEDAFN